MPTNGVSTEPLKVKLLAGEQQATESCCLCPRSTCHLNALLTSHYCRDWRWLLRDPPAAQGPRAEGPNETRKSGTAVDATRFVLLGWAVDTTVCCCSSLFPILIHLYLTAVGLDLLDFIFWKSRSCPLNPQKVELFAEGSTATKYWGGCFG